jgi:hypothetical protein
MKAKKLRKISNNYIYTKMLVDAEAGAKEHIELRILGEKEVNKLKKKGFGVTVDSNKNRTIIRW